jgi:hypothetical protein
VREQGEESWLNNGEIGTVAATSTISSSAELRDKLPLASLLDRKGDKAASPYKCSKRERRANGVVLDGMGARVSLKGLRSGTRSRRAWVRERNMNGRYWAG